MAATPCVPILAEIDRPLQERLERGEVLVFPPCPFPLADGDDRLFLFGQNQGRIHKNISYNPHTDWVSGFCRQSPEHPQRLRQLLRDFGEQATTWLAGALPRYAVGWRRDRVSYRPEEEAIRPLRLNARNDLLHLDAFPSRPTGGARILRLFANINRTDPRVWVTSDTFAVLFEKFGAEVGGPRAGEVGWPRRLGQRLVSLFRPGGTPRSDYDSFMLRFHQFLKSNEAFQERCRKQFWKFPPGSAWLAFTDTVSHAELRGRYALEHSFFVPLDCLLLPDESPAALLERASRGPQRRAA